jgi:hypothetical protein
MVIVAYGNPEIPSVATFLKFSVNMPLGLRVKLQLLLGLSVKLQALLGLRVKLQVLLFSD